MIWWHKQRAMGKWKDHMSEACTLRNIKLTSISYCCPQVIMSHETPHPQQQAWPGGRFTNVSRALQNIISKFVSCKNRTFYGNVKLKLCMWAHLGTRMKFQLGILTINVIFGILYFRENILKSSRNVSETTPSPVCHGLSSMHISFVMEDQPQIGLLYSWIIPKQISPPAQTTELQFYLYVSHGNYQGQETWFL